MILSFACKHTEALFTTGKSRKFSSFKSIAERKLAQLDAATALEDLRVPPGNQLEALSNDRAGQYSIRVNKQFRVCFVWTKHGPARVEIVDYH
nr:type II toxin-antitoxin system RelE/ParE family toxin [Oceanococcus sp. HetDA_MAG_MS8]